MRFVLTSIALLAPLSVNSAELLNSFGSVKFGYADWDTGTKNLNRGDLYKFVLDGGMVFDKGEFFGFYEYNKVDYKTDDRNYSMMMNGSYRLGDSGFGVFGKVYSSIENTWGDEVNTFLGISYLDFKVGGLIVKPYLTIHDISSDYRSTVEGSANGFNGYMLGWNAFYPFTLWGQNFTVVNWNEFEIDRNEAYSEQQGGDFGINGSLTLNWRAFKDVSFSVSYRYFDNKLGWEGWGDQMNYRVSYHF